MLLEIIEEVRVNLKDRLRDIRHLAQQHRHDNAMATRRRGMARPTPFFLPIEVEGLLRHGVSALDRALSAAQPLVLRVPPGNVPTVKGFLTYFPIGQRHAFEAERAFRRDMYDVVRMVLRRRNSGDMLVHEADFVVVHLNMRQRQRKAFSDLANAQSWTDRIAPAASLSASLLIEFLALRPSRAEPLSFSLSSVNDVDQNHAISCLAPVVLACGLATVDPESSSELDLMHVAGLVTDARIERLKQAYNSVDPQTELTALFSRLLAHLL